MAKSIDLAPEPSRLASLLLSYIPAVCAFVAPRHPGASAAIFERLSYSRALRLRQPWMRRAGIVPRVIVVFESSVEDLMRSFHAPMPPRDEPLPNPSPNPSSQTDALRHIRSMYPSPLIGWRGRSNEKRQAA